MIEFRHLRTLVALRDAGSLVEAAAFMKTASQAQLWNQRFAEAMDEVTTQEARSKSIAPLRVDSALITPRPFNIYGGY